MATNFIRSSAMSSLRRAPDATAGASSMSASHKTETLGFRIRPGTKIQHKADDNRRLWREGGRGVSRRHGLKIRTQDLAVRADTPGESKFDEVASPSFGFSWRMPPTGRRKWVSPSLSAEE